MDYDPRSRRANAIGTAPGDYSLPVLGKVSVSIYSFVARVPGKVSLHPNAASDAPLSYEQ